MGRASFSQAPVPLCLSHGAARIRTWVERVMSCPIGVVWPACRRFSADVDASGRGQLCRVWDKIRDKVPLEVSTRREGPPRPIAQADKRVKEQHSLHRPVAAYPRRRTARRRPVSRARAPRPTAARAVVLPGDRAWRIGHGRSMRAVGRRLLQIEVAATEVAPGRPRNADDERRHWHAPLLGPGRGVASAEA
jgi:hypothetical protein